MKGPVATEGGLYLDICAGDSEFHCWWGRSAYLARASVWTATLLLPSVTRRR